MRLAAANGLYAGQFLGDWSPGHALSSAVTAHAPMKLVIPRGESPEAKKVHETLTILERQLQAPTAFSDEAGRAFPLLLSQVDVEPVEDGMTHPAETYVAEFVRNHGAEDLPTLLSLTDPCRRASVLRLLGRSDAIDVATRIELIESALVSTDLQLRDAAVHAAEQWADPELAEVLRGHHEPTPWLAEYIDAIVGAISGQDA